VSGSCSQLGRWGIRDSIRMSSSEPSVWEARVQLREDQFPFWYKFVERSEDDPSIEWWEQGGNREANFPHIRGGRADVVVFNDESRQSSSSLFKGSGVAVPLFSIRSKHSMGVGEFPDLVLLADWAQQSGVMLIQLLPIIDTSVNGNWRDSYPYSSLSVFALHPQYIRIDDLTNDKKLLERIRTSKKQLNDLVEIDYEAVMKTKMEYLREIYKTIDSNRRKQLEQFAATSDWVKPYAAFCVLKEIYQSPVFTQWPREHLYYSNDLFETLKAQSEFYIWIQLVAHEQMSAAARLVREHGIVLKGDIPIGVNRWSADTWCNPHLFRMDMSTGAPPDFFADLGQNWGFPTYNWTEMEKDGYAWWRQRLQSMAQYFDAYRIDHILGFFRIWEIPLVHKSGLLGRFNPSIAVDVSELQGLEIDRLCKPYIRKHLMEREWGDGWKRKARLYMRRSDAPNAESDPVQRAADDQAQLAVDALENADGFFDAYAYDLKSQYATEKGALTAEAEDREILLRFVRNVVLLRDSEHWYKFYPRIDCHKTSSFAELDEAHKFRLRDLYIDYFYKRQDAMWANVAMSRLPALLSATNMLVCGEDLGMIPDCVPHVMEELHMLGLRVQRMPADSKKEFYHPHEYPYMTVCTTSVHDTSTFRGWWEEDAPTTQRYFNRVLGFDGQAPYFCETWVMQRVLQQHLYSQSMWAIFPIQDLMAMDNELRKRDPKQEQINVPANADHYWRYRMHVLLEDLISNKAFSGTLRGLIAPARSVAEFRPVE
jgi:4-alpha-glucanotransferase